jgi:hypothetical protein
MIMKRTDKRLNIEQGSKSFVQENDHAGLRDQAYRRL